MPSLRKTQIKYRNEIRTYDIMTNIHNCFSTMPIKLIFVKFECQTSICNCLNFKLLLNILLIKYSVYNVTLDAKLRYG